MKISFITPTFNRKHLVDETIQSIVSLINYQSKHSIEIVIIDDASIDDTYNTICHKYDFLIQSGFMRIHRMENNVGVTGAKNQGALLADGEWLVFIDSDDLMIVESFPAMIEKLEKLHRYDVVFFTCIDFSGKIIGVDFKDHELTINEYIYSGTFGEKLPVIKRDTFLSYKYDQNLRGFESLTYFKMLADSKKFWISNLPCRKYRTINGDRLSSRSAQFKRSGTLAAGYKLLISEYVKKFGSAPKILYLKLMIYSFANYFIKIR